MISGFIESRPGKPRKGMDALRAITAVALLAGLGGCATGLPDRVKNSIDMEFVYVNVEKRQIFMMGCSPGDRECQSDERPQHAVKINEGFYLGKYEVTQAQWEAIMGNNPSRFQGDKRPVDSVSWNDARDFIRRLNEKEGTDKYRLPTEAEWEYAARAETVTKFPFEEARAGDYAWYWKNAGHGTHPVGTKLPNPWKLHDMHGNVWEWVQDWYHPDYYALSQTTSPSVLVKTRELVTGSKVVVVDPQGATEGTGRVLRGGSWSNDLRYLRSPHRNFYAPDYRSSNVGFRVAVTPDKEWLKKAKEIKDDSKQNAQSGHNATVP